MVYINSMALTELTLTLQGYPLFAPGQHGNTQSTTGPGIGQGLSGMHIRGVYEGMHIRGTRAEVQGCEYPGYEGISS